MCDQSECVPLFHIHMRSTSSCTCGGAVCVYTCVHARVYVCVCVCVCMHVCVCARVYARVLVYFSQRTRALYVSCSMCRCARELRASCLAQSLHASAAYRDVVPRGYEISIPEVDSDVKYTYLPPNTLKCRNSSRIDRLRGR